MMVFEMEILEAFKIAFSLKIITLPERIINFIT